MSTPRRDLHAGEIFRRLTSRGVDFVVIGGIAAVLHGSARNTYDLDICFATDDVNLQALGEVLVDLGARLRGVDDDVAFVPDATTLRRIQVLTLDTSEGYLDVLASPAGAPPYKALAANADRFDVGGVAVRVAAVDDLIAMKRAAGRDKDLIDVAELEAIARLRRRADRR